MPPLWSRNLRTNQTTRSPEPNHHNMFANCCPSSIVNELQPETPHTVNCPAYIVNPGHYVSAETTLLVNLRGLTNFKRSQDLKRIDHYQQ